MKAVSIVEGLSFLGGFFYGKKSVVFIKTESNRLEKHYFDILDGKIQIYSANSSDHIKNPKIVGNELVFESKSKRDVYVWRENEDIAYPLGITGKYEREIITSRHFRDIFAAGQRFQELNDMAKQLKTDSGNTTLLLIGVLIIGLVNTLFLYLIASEMGLV